MNSHYVCEDLGIRRIHLVSFDQLSKRLGRFILPQQRHSQPIETREVIRMCL